MLGLPCSMTFSLVVESEGYSLVTVHRLLIAVPSLGGKHRPWDARASVVAAPRL